MGLYNTTAEHRLNKTVRLFASFAVLSVLAVNLVRKMYNTKDGAGEFEPFYYRLEAARNPERAERLERAMNHQEPLCVHRNQMKCLSVTSPTSQFAAGANRFIDHSQ